MIAPAHYDRVREHFLHACSLETTERRKYLAEISLTTEERGALDQLLAADAELDGATEGWLARPDLEAALPDGIPAPAAASGALQHVPPPERIGPYKICERLGEGGMGIVFRAEQKTPVRRDVAIKVMKRGFDPGPIVARFEAERQALANLNHPGITQILDAGVCPTGEPYFVMEQVDGAPITDHCRTHALSLTERLELFGRVCAAVQHAHTKGIIHRDLKPSNILVTTQDGEAAPKIIDFGIAKGVEATPGSVALTLEGVMIGTPAYMSPEQAAGSSDLDTRTDVYSLGVVLYELLTGALPFDPEAWRNESFAEIARVIREEAPPRPSSRWTTTSGETTDPSTPLSTRRELRGDLDWIILRALEKDPTRRYESPARLADDILRHLRDEPVLAGPPSARYVIGKYLRRHKSGAALGIATFGALVTGLATGFGGPMVAATAVLVLLLGGILSSSALLRRARFAREAEARQRELAEQQRAQSEENRRLAAQHLDEVLRLADRQRLAALEARAEALWPAEPDLIPDYDRWLEEAGRLAARLDDHRRFLTELREQAEPSTDADSKFRFPTPELQWWHDCAAELVAGLERFVDSDPHTGALASIRARRERARTLPERSVESPEAQAAWQRAIEDIATLPIYQGLTLTPQLGLFPLERNPHSGLWEFWHVESGARPTASETGGRVGEESGIVLILIPGGVGSIGAQKADPSLPHFDPAAEENEGPVTSVELAPYFIARTAVTQGQWFRATGKNPSVYGVDRNYGGKQHDLRHPVEHVSWDECHEVLAQLDLDLPTEAQWEFAVRAGSTTPWWTGEKAETLAGAANLADRFAKENGAPQSWEFEEWLDDGYTTHAPVGTYRANPFGLEDVHGNVWEWCLDQLGMYPDAERAPRTGELLVEPNERRILRGGSFQQTSAHARSSNRNLSYRTYRASCLGVRPTRAIRSGKATP